MPLELKEGAVFITDAHYPRNKEDFLALLDALISAPPPQVFMLGDMFEFLCSYVPYTIDYNKEAIDALNLLAAKTEIIYLEGNHDYLISSIFPSIRTISMSQQPLFVSYLGKQAVIMHGDKYGDKGYLIYSALIRNPFFIRFLRVITVDIGGRFIKQLYKKLLAKKICKNIDGFEQKKLASVSSYPLYGVSQIIEGHNHVRISATVNGLKYEALSAFACNKSFFKVEFGQSDLCFAETSLGALKNEQA